MAALEVKYELTEFLGENNSVVAFDVLYDGLKVCRYNELLKHYNVSIDVLLEHYMTFDAKILTMKEVGEHSDFIRKATSVEAEFLHASVLNQALQLKKKLGDIVNFPTKYMMELVRDRELHNPIYFSVFPMSDPVVEECEAHPHEMAVAIMGEKAADALMFIPNMLEWSVKFPNMKGIASDLVEMAKEAKVLVQEELAKIPAEAEQEEHPLFFTWWHLDHVNYQLEYNLENVKL